jgi:hypothetical protein
LEIDFLEKRMPFKKTARVSSYSGAFWIASKSEDPSFARESAELQCHRSWKTFRCQSGLTENWIFVNCFSECLQKKRFANSFLFTFVQCQKWVRPTRRLLIRLSLTMLYSICRVGCISERFGLPNSFWSLPSKQSTKPEMEM